MSLFRRKNNENNVASINVPAMQTVPSPSSSLADIALNTITDGVLIVDSNGVIQYLNAAGLTILECDNLNNAIGLDYGLLIKIEDRQEKPISDEENPLLKAIRSGEQLTEFRSLLVASKSHKKVAFSFSVLPAQDKRIITFRDITEQLKEEGEQTEFISTASHEMRTPVASIEGYLGLALNPSTATIDDRAKGYLESAHNASKHLGKLFQDLLDVTKLDDGRIEPKFVPVEMSGVVKKMCDEYMVTRQDSKIQYQFGTGPEALAGAGVVLNQTLYAAVDMDFLNETMNNLMENAIKYTPDGGRILVNVVGDETKITISVADTGMGIPPSDLPHIFQKFYRADNTDTREIGGTGLGLYLVKKRVEAMHGQIWAESAINEGTTFYVSLPRISSEEYQNRSLILKNQQAQEILTAGLNQERNKQ